VTTLALVGDLSPSVPSHLAVPRILMDAAIGWAWLPTDRVADHLADLRAADGIWLLPGSPYRDFDGALLAARVAREEGIPFLGTCGGFQHAVIEFARGVAGLGRAGHTEYGDDPHDAVVVALACAMQDVDDPVRLVPGTLAAALAGAAATNERYRCSYGLAAAAEAVLVGHGLVVSGRDPSGDVRVVELPGHPFWLATAFQPELAREQPHPLIAGFLARAAVSPEPPPPPGTPGSGNVGAPK
jgi:CTP synthase (UTP-ammonia lyase)